MVRVPHRATQAGGAAVAVAALFVSACSGGNGALTSGPESKPVTGGTVTMDLAGPLTGFDPAKGGTYQDYVALMAAYDSLVAYDSSGKIIPGLASRWRTTPSSATFTLKPGVTCSDGTPLTPKIVAASLSRFFDPKTAAPTRALAVGTATNTAKVTTGENTVTIALDKPFSGLLAGLTMSFTGIVCQAGLDAPDALRTKSAGTGAFVTESQVSGSTYTLTRRAGYNWGPAYADQKPGRTPTKLVMKVVTDDNTRANLMATGALQIGAYSSRSWTRFRSSKGVAATLSQQSDTMLAFNENPGHPTADPAVRKAISQAVNRAQLNNVQSYGAGRLIDNLGDRDYQCYDESLGSKVVGHDPAAAAKVLRGRKIQVIGTNILAGGAANNYVLSALRAAGADASLKNLDNAAYVNSIFAGKNPWDVTVLVFGNSASNMQVAGSFFAGPAPPAGLNIGGVKNRAAATALARASAAASEPEMCAAMSAFHEALLTNHDVVPLATVPVRVLFAGGTSGVAFKGFVRASTIRIDDK
jgi:peptide/nickel transport system substrate-binding protein